MIEQKTLTGNLTQELKQKLENRKALFNEETQGCIIDAFDITSLFESLEIDISEVVGGLVTQLQDLRDEALKEARKHSNNATNNIRGLSEKEANELHDPEIEEKIRCSDVGMAYDKILKLLGAKKHKEGNQ